MNCQSYKNQIDEQAVSAEVLRHLEKCADCKTFKEERECLSALIGKLERINAPANFEFGVKAKLSSLPSHKRGARAWQRRFVFATPVLAAVTVSAFVWTNYKAFSPDNQQTTPVSAETNAPQILAPSSTVVSHFQPSAAATTVSPAIAEAAPKQNEFQSLKNNIQFTARKAVKQESRKIAQGDIQSKTIDEPTNSRILSVAPSEAPHLPAGISTNTSTKIAAHEAFTFFGLEISDDGSVKSVKPGSVGGENGIAVGDKIETVNGQKTTEANLESPLNQVTIEVLRNGNKRKVTMNVKGSLPK